MRRSRCSTERKAGRSQQTPVALEEREEEVVRHRTLGARAEVAAIGRGTMGLTMAYEPIEAEADIAALRRTHDLGVTLSDTAEM